jgi:hypothetical protein
MASVTPNNGRNRRRKNSWWDGQCTALALVLAVLLLVLFGILLKQHRLPWQQGGKPGTETEAPETTPEPETTEEPAPSEPPARQGFPWLTLIFVLLLLMALLVAAVFLMDPARRAQRNPRRAGEILTSAVNAGMERLFRPRRTGETVIEYYDAAAERFPDLPLGGLAEAYSARIYGQKPMRAELALNAWRRVSDRLSFFQRIAVILSGIFASGK